MKVTEINGYKYSLKEFDGHKFRAMFRFRISQDFREDSVINIYTDNPNKEEVKEVINSRKADRVTSCNMEHWITKEQDDLTAKFIEETLKDF